MKKLLENGYNAKLRPSGHDISENFSKDNQGAIPANLIVLAKTDSNGVYLRRCRDNGIKPHPARFPHALPEFFIHFLTDPGDLVVDPFAGSNVTGEIAESNQRRWMAFELNERYLQASQFRFPEEAQSIPLFTLDRIEDTSYETELKESQRHLSQEFFSLVKALYTLVTEEALSLEEMSDRLGLSMAQTNSLLDTLQLTILDKSSP